MIVLTLEKSIELFDSVENNGMTIKHIVNYDVTELFERIYNDEKCGHNGSCKIRMLVFTIDKRSYQTKVYNQGIDRRIRRKMSDLVSKSV